MKPLTNFLIAIFVLVSMAIPNACYSSGIDTFLNGEIEIFNIKDYQKQGTCFVPDFKKNKILVSIEKISSVEAIYIITIFDKIETIKFTGVVNLRDEINNQEEYYLAKINHDDMLDVFLDETHLTFQVCLKEKSFIKGVGGSIAGTVTSSSTGLPISDGFIIVYDSLGSYLGLTSLDNSGNYSYSGLDAGNYYIRTDSTGYFDELWNDMPCAQDNCTVTNGNPVVVSNSMVTANFILDNGGSIAGTVTSSSTGLPISDGFVIVYDSIGSYLGLTSLDNSGNYSYSGLDAGNYYIRTDNTGYFDELWNDIPCAQDNCIVTTGNVISVNNNAANANFILGEQIDSIFVNGFE